jgi:hypothetical protein
VARRIGGLYYNMGILGSSDYVECSASDLIGQYVGHTGPKTQGKLTEALGRVLFIDEAYRFCDGQFGAEAVNELVDCLTKPKFMGKLVVILAGYTHQIDDLLRINPGLSSRFPEEVVFENMDPEKCIELLDREIKKQGIDVAPPMSFFAAPERQQMIDIFRELSKLPSWGNGRDVMTISKNICSDAFASDRLSEIAVTAADILRHLNKMFNMQKARNEVRKDSRIPFSLSKSEHLPTLTKGPPKDSVKATFTTPTTNATEPIPVVEDELPDDDGQGESVFPSPQRDPGVSDEVWQQLQRSVAEERARKQAGETFIAASQQEYEAQRDAEQAGLCETRRLEEEKCLANEKRRKEIEVQLRDEKKRIEAAEKAKRDAEETLRKAREEAEKKRREELAIQKKIKELGVCPLGYRWIKEGGGYRCGGGSHYLSNSLLGL